MTSSDSPRKFYGEKEPSNLWESICEEFSKKRQQLENEDVGSGDVRSVSTQVTQFSASKHSPAVYGNMVHETFVDLNTAKDFDPSVGHPALVGLCLLQKPNKPSFTLQRPPLKPKTCSPSDYLEEFVFPVLLPALREMLNEAGRRKCFEKTRFGFNPSDFIVEYLYKNNHNKDSEIRESRKKTELFDIPFVAKWLVDHPRKPLPLSLIWSEEEAAIKIQAFYRGYRTRVRPDVAELRQWQQDWREENADIRKKVEDFWVEAETRAANEALASGRNSRVESARNCTMEKVN